MGRDSTKKGKVEREGKLEKREKKENVTALGEGKSRREETQRAGKMHEK